MKTLRLALFALALVAAGFMAGRWRASPSGATAEAARPSFQCPMHPAVVQDHQGDCPVCGMKLVPLAGATAAAGAARPAGTVTLDGARRQLQGVRVGTVERKPASHALRLFGRVVPDENRVYSLNAPLDGSVRTLADVTTGSRVRQGQWLGSVFMADTRAALQAYITALDVQDMDPQLRRHEGMTVSAGTTPTKSALFTVERLRALGVSQRQIDGLRTERIIPNAIDLYAPADGWVLSRGVSLEQKFDKGMEWFRIANLEKVWVLADVPDADAALVRPGQKAVVTLPGGRGTLAAVVGQVPPTFDKESSTLKVRLLVDNPGAQLRPEMYVDVDLAVERAEALTVPVDAVVDGGVRKTVFVEKGDGLFEPRRVETGLHLGDRVEVVKGLAAGERIVVSGTFMVDSESQMRAAAEGYRGEAEAAAAPVAAPPPVTQAAATPAKAGAATRDPICGMVVDEARARAAGLVHEHGGQVHFFCSEHCRKTFAAQPGAKQTSSEEAAPPAGDHDHHHGEHGRAPAARAASL